MKYESLDSFGEIRPSVPPSYVRLSEENAHVIMSCVRRISILNESDLHQLTATEQTNALMKKKQKNVISPHRNAEFEALPGDISICIVYSIRPIQINVYFPHPYERGKRGVEPPLPHLVPNRVGHTVMTRKEFP